MLHFTDKDGADSVINFSSIKEFCCAVWNNGSVGVLFDYENKTVKGIGSSLSGTYLKCEYSSGSWKITALQAGKYNVINGSGVLSEIEAEAGNILISSNSYKYLVYCAAWI